MRLRELSKKFLGRLAKCWNKSIAEYKYNKKAWRWVPCEIEAAYSGYLGGQDTFYFGLLKYFGRVFKQTYIDIYSKVAHTKLNTSRKPTASVDLVND